MFEITTNGAQSSLVDYTDKKGRVHGLTMEGAVFGPTAAVAAVRSAAVQAAVAKAAHGKYRAAAEILAGAFPAKARAFAKFYGDEPAWANKARFAAFVLGVATATPGKSGAWTQKQSEARILIVALGKLPGFKVDAQLGEVVEAPVVEAPVVEAPVVEAPVVEAPVVEAPVVEAPVVEAKTKRVRRSPSKAKQRVEA